MAEIMKNAPILDLEDREIKMRELQTISDELTNALRLGSAVGQLKMLKVMEPAISDGMRHGSPECAGLMGQWSQLKNVLTSEIVESLDDLGIQVTLTSPSIELLDSH